MRIDELMARVPHVEALQAAREAVATPAWLVGGTVRDLLLGRMPADVDITSPEPEPLAQAFAEISNGHVVPMDLERGVWRVAIGEGRYLDFCRFRDSDIVGDLRGRDFTINAIAVRLPEYGDDGGLLDPFHGLDDLNAGLLRMVDARAFRDDPLRVLRAFRFLAELGLRIDDDTWRLLTAEVGGLAGVAVERVLAEWWKICAGPHVARAIESMDEAQALGLLFPELGDAKGVEQNLYHHLDVWEHSLLTVTLLARFLQHPETVFQDLQSEFTPLLYDEHRRARLVFTALVHDIGKPMTRSEEHGKVHFYTHEQAGAEIAGRLADRLRISREDSRALETIVRCHLRPLFLMQQRKKGELSRRSMLRFFDDAGPHALDVMALALADKSAGRGPASEPEVQEHLRELYRELFVFYQSRYLPAQQLPLLTGHDLLEELHLTPGPEIKHLLGKVREMQMLGTLTSHEEALEWARGERE